MFRLEKLQGDRIHTGNISGICWKSKSDDMKRGYGFRYDAIGRLREASYAAMAPGQTKWISEVDQYSVPEIRYDVNGNILKLKRNGWLTTSAFGQMDNLLYSYSGNQLTSVTDAAAATGINDFRDNGSTGANEFSYDANGNLIVDGNKSLSAEYNHLNLPTKVDFGGGDELHYLYDATGTKLARRMKQGGSPLSVRVYMGEFVYEGAQLEYFTTTEGRVVKTPGAGQEFRYEYFYRDHLGNTRMRFSDLDGNGVAEKSEILQEWSYYPYGLTFEGLGSPSVGTLHREGFNGKELESEFGLGWNDFGARRYDAALGRWCGVDALGEETPQFSPYVGLHNNPITFLDPNGNSGVASIEGDEIVIRSHLIFYGVRPTVSNGVGRAVPASDLQMSQLVSGYASEIMNQSNIGGTREIDGHNYNVRFEITASFRDDVTPEEIATNESYLLNYLQIQPDWAKPAMDDGLGGANTGRLRHEDRSNTVKTHEYWHGLGLDHLPGSISNVQIGENGKIFPLDPRDARNHFVDSRGQIPNIMFTESNIVDRQYRLDPGHAGRISISNGVVVFPTRTARFNQDHRRVQQSDINGINFAPFKNGVSNVGALTNQYHRTY